MAFSTFYGSTEKYKTIPTSSIDLSASISTPLTMVIPTGWEGQLSVNDCFMHVTEAIGAATTNGTVLITWTPSGGSETTIGTFNTDGLSANTIQQFTPATNYEKSGLKLTAGGTLKVDHTVQASGGTTTGAVTVYLSMFLHNLSR